MRVIAGKARRTALKTVEGLNTRPTTDRIKETLFNMIHNELYDCRFLDLFSGSGAIGIEALSRGAREAVFVENSADAANCIRENLTKARLTEQSILMEEDVLLALRKLNCGNGNPFDFIFMDPPYNKMLEKLVLYEMKDMDFVDEYTTIIIEASLETDISDYIDDIGFYVYKIKEYKTNKHIFVKKGIKEK